MLLRVGEVPLLQQETEKVCNAELWKICLWHHIHGKLYNAWVNDQPNYISYIYHRSLIISFSSPICLCPSVFTYGWPVRSLWQGLFLCLCTICKGILLYNSELSAKWYNKYFITKLANVRNWAISKLWTFEDLKMSDFKWIKASSLAYR